jgi:hypothetical protein
MKSLDYRTWGLVEAEVGRRLAQHRTHFGHHALGATLGCGHSEGWITHSRSNVATSIRAALWDS